MKPFCLSCLRLMAHRLTVVERFVLENWCKNGLVPSRV